MPWPGTPRPKLFLSTLSLRRATLSHCAEQVELLISIHALLAESDFPMLSKNPPAALFLSTLSLRRATPSAILGIPNQVDFYPRSPCGERPTGGQTFEINLNFYPRSPCGERLRPVNVTQIFNHFYPRSPCGERHFADGLKSTHWIFLSTLSLRRATPHAIKKSPRSIISIHALLAESDLAPTTSIFAR